jgi:hypothetical protein
MRSIVILLMASSMALGAGGLGCSAPAGGETESGSDAIVSAQPASERAAIMDALRARVKPDLGGQDIVFNVSQGTFNVQDGWCWLAGTVELRGGGEPTTVGTAYEEAANEGVFDGFRIEALLEKQGGAWQVVDHGLGSTDVWYAGLASRHPEAPISILPELAR